VKKDELTEVYPGIFRITERGVLGMLKPPVNIYVITGSNGLVYDSGYGNRSSVNSFIRQFNEINRICRERGYENRIDRILLSHAHADHFSGLKKLRESLGFRIIVTDEIKRIISSRKVYTDSYSPPEKIEKKTLPEKLLYAVKLLIHKIEYGLYGLYWGVSYVSDPDIVIPSDTGIEINGEQWRIFISPGHSHEHITLYNKESGILFSGDNVMKSINVWLGPPKSDLDDYEASLTSMSNLPGLKIILPAHGSPVTDPYGRIGEIIEWRRKRTIDILNLIKSSTPEGITAKGILNKLYPGESRMKKEFAAGWVELTLQKLEKENKITRKDGRYFF
jgi:glyoxylase-like metal-dependent hydrolase (beta-lactamase superfamily II)